MLQIVKRASQYPDRIAIRSNRKNYAYAQLLQASKQTALQLLDGKNDLNEDRIAFIVPPGFDYVKIQWGIWRAGGIAVPLYIKHPFPSIKYVVDDSHASVIIYSKEYEQLISPLFNSSGIRFIRSIDFDDQKGNLPEIHSSRRAMILYTSGTTGSPKGVVTTHQIIESQITTLVEAWKWSKDDYILNVLPLHHVHGIINVLCCALWSGACCEFLFKFDEEKVFEIFCKNEVNVFMAVPTIYYKLIAYWNELPVNHREKTSESLRRFRLMISGSAALPVSVLKKWEKISGHTLLERYGMTEIGMAISNPYEGNRKPGYIGQPLPKVQIRITDENGLLQPEGKQGQIEVRGPNVFKEYWNKPEATAEAFTSDGWFKTGDIAILENGAYKILGRNSVDIIKSGGYKISALEIEEVLRTYPGIKECGVVGIPDEEWGEIIGVSLILNKKEIDLEQLKNWLKDKLPNYKIPRKYIIQEGLPRNVMGKVTKNELKERFRKIE